MADHRVTLVPNAGWDERILVFQCERLVAAFAVITERYVVLIDTLINPASALAMWEAVQPAVSATRPLVVINTHADWDHCWGNQVFSGPDAINHAVIIGHDQCRVRLLEPAAHAELARKQAEDPDCYGTVRIEPPQLTFSDQCTISGGDLTLHLVPTPGHTPDHIAVFIPEIKTLFAGDAAELPLPFVDLAGDAVANLAQLRRSLQRMLALDPQTVLYCHAPGVTNAQVIEHNEAYFADLGLRVEQALHQGVLPLTLAAQEDQAALLGYPIQAVAGTTDLNAEELAFYAEAHAQAIEATLRTYHQQ